MAVLLPPSDRCMMGGARLGRDVHRMSRTLDGKAQRLCWDEDE